jgi:hypothetical protein
MKSRNFSVFSTFLQISGSQKKSQTYSNLQNGFVEIHWLNGILGWRSHHMPKARQLLAPEELGVRENRQVLFLNKYLMHTYQASVRAQVQGRSQVIRTEVRALNAQDARWLLWAQWGFHSIQSGPTQVNNSN